MSTLTQKTMPTTGPRRVESNVANADHNEPSIPIGSRWPHRIACLMAAIVFPLIWVGNLVTTADAGMAVPDWPNTYGYNLFLYPYHEWFFGPWDLFVEHGHRLLASLAGLVAIVLVVATYRSEERAWVKWLSSVILGLVIFQGLLGGIRVIYDARWVAKVHGCIGPAFFAATIAYCVVTSRWWLTAVSTTGPALPWRPARRISKLAITMLGVSYLQLCFGAFIRHIDDTASPRQFMWLVAAHVVTAVLLVLGTLTQFALTRTKNWRGLGLKSSINILSLLILIQFSLGLGTWIVKWGWPIWFENYELAAGYVIPEKSFLQMNVVTTHAALGSLILAFWVVHALRTNRVAASFDSAGLVSRAR